VRLRDLLPIDRAPLAALLSKVGNLNEDECAVALELVDEKLEKPDTSTYRFFMAVDDVGTEERLLGYLCWGRTPMTERTVDLYWIVVDQALQGRGVGRFLLVALEDQMRDEGLLTIRVETASSEAYNGTIAFYEKTAFELSGRIRDFYKDDDDLLIFTKRIASR
jgi:ribosomal protein S18 acetylase RimI-like enzyme